MKRLLQLPKINRYDQQHGVFTCMCGARTMAAAWRTPGKQIKPQDPYLRCPSCGLTHCWGTQDDS